MWGGAQPADFAFTKYRAVTDAVTGDTYFPRIKATFVVAEPPMFNIMPFRTGPT